MAPKKTLFTSNGGIFPSKAQTLALGEEPYFPFPDVGVTVFQTARRLLFNASSFLPLA